MRLDEIDLIIRQAILRIELLVDLRDGERPVDIRAGREILQRDENVERFVFCVCFLIPTSARKNFVLKY